MLTYELTINIKGHHMYDKERRDEDWVNPPDDDDKYEPDWDAINDDQWLENN